MPERSPRILWETALGQLELQVTRPNFETWLRDSVALRGEGDQLIVGVSSDFAIEWLRSRLSPLINRAVSRITGREATVVFEVLGAQETSSNHATSNNSSGSSTPPPPALHPELTFDTFTVVKSYQLAYRAARDIATGNRRYNPLLLCGPPGLGKTHLLHAIGHEAYSKGHSTIILTAEEFVNRYTSAVRTGQPHTFRNPFATIDLLLLDDLQFLGTRQGSQQQLFHILDAALLRDKTLVLTSDTPPEVIQGLSPALLSRLQSGLIAELRLPPPAERLQILRAMAIHSSFAIPDDILQLIHRLPCSHIRDLQGALNRIIAFADLSSEPLTIKTASLALYSPSISSATPTPSAILKLICSYFNLSIHDLTGPSRARDITYARHIAMYLLHQH
ncbi:MAG: ATP-binding protein, partial [Chloroflexi bacterium]|nr:ATP-binding protein [Chloroflexota bacterium]